MQKDRKMMKRTYVKPMQRVDKIDTVRLVCQSRLEYSDEEYANHGQDEVLAKRGSIWDDLW